jgi:hypothetical protein
MHTTRTVVGMGGQPQGNVAAFGGAAKRTCCSARPERLNRCTALKALRISQRMKKDL